MSNPLHLLKRVVINVHSIDFHDCVFNSGWLKRVNAFNGNALAVQHVAAMAAANEALLTSIKKTTQLDKPQKVLFMLGSACQSYLDDHRHRIKGVRKSQPISVFEGLGFLKDAAARAIDSPHAAVELDPYLLADSFDDLPSGTSFARALQAREMGSKGVHHANWVLDDTKMLILYAQANRIAASLSANARLKFHFYDDKRKILDELARFYRINWELIPRNTTLILSQYSGEGAPEVLHEVTGTAPAADTDYHRSIQKITELCGYEHDFTTITRLSRDFTPARVEAFKAWRNIGLDDKSKLPHKKIMVLQLPKETPTPAFFKRPPVKEIIKILSFDFDKCLYNELYLEKMRKCLTDKPDMTWGEFLEAQNETLNLANDALFKEIADGISKIKDIARVKLISGTGRQSYKDDMINRLTGPVQTGSAHQALLMLRNKIEDTLSPLIKGVEVEVCYLLLADIYADLLHGSSFRLALAQMHKDAIAWRSHLMSKIALEHCDKHPSWVFDDSKLTLIYAHLHQARIEHPHAEITYDFYDDRDDILENLNVFLRANLNLIPAGIILTLNQYAGKTVKQIAVLKGEGLVDFNYNASIKQMVELSGHSLTDYYRIINVLAPLRAGDTLAKFQQWQRGFTSCPSYSMGQKV